MDEIRFDRVDGVLLATVRHGSEEIEINNLFDSPDWIIEKFQNHGIEYGEAHNLTQSLSDALRRHLLDSPRSLWESGVVSPLEALECLGDAFSELSRNHGIDIEEN